MTQILETLLFPIIFLMDMVLSAGFWLTGSHGLAILLLSIVVFLALTPLRKIALRIQDREADLQARMAGPLREARQKYRGEKQFNEIERIYEEFDYHPIKAMRSAIGVGIQIPFLLSALLLLIDHPGMQGEPFLFISDLGRPDGLLPLPFGSAFGVDHLNVLPVIMLGLSMVESMLSTRHPTSAKLQANTVGIVIFVIIYPLASALVLYWTFNNLWSLLAAKLRQWRDDGRPAEER